MPFAGPAALAGPQEPASGWDGGARHARLPLVHTAADRAHPRRCVRACVRQQRRALTKALGFSAFSEHVWPVCPQGGCATACASPELPDSPREDVWLVYPQGTETRCAPAASPSERQGHPPVPLTAPLTSSRRGSLSATTSSPRSGRRLFFGQRHI